MNEEAALKQQRLRSTKRQFANEAADEAFNYPMKGMEVNFNVVVDFDIQS